MKIKNFLMSLIVLMLVVGALFSVTPVYAQDRGSSGNINFFQRLVQFITEKFGLDKTQVQTAMEEFKQDKPEITPRPTSATPMPTMSQEDLEAQQKKRLDSLVEQGKITSDQETAILAELETLRTKYSPDSMKDLTQEERKSQMEAMQKELKTWTEEKGIDISYVSMFGPGEFGEKDRQGQGGPDMQRGNKPRGQGPSAPNK